MIVFLTLSFSWSFCICYSRFYSCFFYIWYWTSWRTFLSLFLFLSFSIFSRDILVCILFWLYIFSLSKSFRCFSICGWMIFCWNHSFFLSYFLLKSENFLLYSAFRYSSLSIICWVICFSYSRSCLSLICYYIFYSYFLSISETSCWAYYFCF